MCKWYPDSDLSRAFPIRTVRKDYSYVRNQDFVKYHQQRDFLAYWEGYALDVRRRRRTSDWRLRVFPVNSSIINGPSFVGPCLIWRGALTKDGYAPHKVRQKLFRVGAGREATQQLNHLCNRRACIQPAHCYDGSSADNAYDRKHESAFQDRTPPNGMTFRDLGKRYDRIFATAERLRVEYQQVYSKELRTYLIHDHDWHGGYAMGVMSGGDDVLVCSVCNMTPLDLAKQPILDAILGVATFANLPVGGGFWLWKWRDLYPQWQEITPNGGMASPWNGSL